MMLALAAVPAELVSEVVEVLVEDEVLALPELLELGDKVVDDGVDDETEETMALPFENRVSVSDRKT
jgi:hypothetical protein